MATISVCMIVKDEEENLPRCLDCLQKFADEIVVVDTGSTDNTKEIAARYTHRVYSFPWTGDFSEARNYSFSLAKMDYIYSADADERLDPENQNKLLLLKKALLPEVEIVQMKYANQLENGGVYNFDEEYRPKLFKRLREFRWVSPIHETVALEPVVFDSDIVIGHYPAQRHAARDFAAFSAAANTGGLDRRLHHMYAMELFIAGEDSDFLRAEPFFAASLEDERRGLEEQCDARCVVSRAARLRGADEIFFGTVLRGVVGNPCAELCCELGDFFVAHGNVKEAAVWYYSAANGAQSVLNIHTSGDTPLRALAACYRALGEDAEAERCETMLSFHQ